MPFHFMSNYHFGYFSWHERYIDTKNVKDPFGVCLKKITTFLPNLDDTLVTIYNLQCMNLLVAEEPGILCVTE